MTSREQRALARSQWTARLVRGSDPGEQAPLQLTADEAWLAVGELTRSLWLRGGGVTKEVFGRRIPFIGVEALRRNKLASGRPKDLADAAWLDTAFPPTTR